MLNPREIDVHQDEQISSNRNALDVPPSVCSDTIAAVGVLRRLTIEGNIVKDRRL